MRLVAIVKQVEAVVPGNTVYAVTVLVHKESNSMLTFGGEIPGDVQKMSFGEAADIVERKLNIEELDEQEVEVSG